MINTKHLLRVVSAWVSIVYTICYAGVAIFPQVRTLFMRYALHTDVTVGSDILGVGYFISGLVIWNIVAIAGAWIFAYLFNTLKH